LGIPLVALRQCSRAQQNTKGDQQLGGDVQECKEKIRVGIFLHLFFGGKESTGFSFLFSSPNGRELSTIIEERGVTTDLVKLRNRTGE
jgi:hypothetical protein